MVGMAVTNGQVGVSSFHGNGVSVSNFGRNSFLSPGFSFCWRPTLGIGLKNNSRILNHGRVNKALSKGGSGSGLVEFKPSFDEYLKVMESVRTVRDRRQASSSETKQPRDKIVRKAPLQEENEENVKMEEFEGHWDQEKGLNFVHNDESFKRVEENVEKVSKRKQESSFVGKAKRKPDGGIGGKWLKNQTGDKYDGETSSFRKLEKKGTYENGIGNDKFREGRERNFIRDDMGIGSYIVPKNGRARSTGTSLERVDDKDLKMERAAFKNFDEFNDIDKPRVPHMEMEERIQKLAKSLNGADIDMPEWMFTKMMRSARIRYTDHSILRVIQILGKFGNWRRVLQVIEWLQMSERFKSNKLRFIYTTALYVLGKAGRPVEALNVFNAMLQQLSSYPDLVAYHSIAVTLGQAGHMKELFDVIDTMLSPPKKNFKTGALGNWDPRLEPDNIVYHAVLNACIQRKQWEGAFWVLQQLKEKNLRPSTTTYGLVMEVMFACGKYNLVHDFFRKVQKSSVPNALIYRVLVNTLWKEGKIDEAVLAVQNMERRGIVGSAALYYDFARCLCSAGRCQEALMQVEKICKVASKPLVVTYTGLIQACLDSGNVKDGEYIFSHMKDFCSPNLVTCNIMLKGYLKHGKFKEAKELFEKMLGDTNHIKRNSDYKMLVSPDIYTFNTLLDACFTEKMWDDFTYVYERMLHHGYHFNAKRHLRMILDASRSGKGELLDITWNHLAEADRTPPSPLIKERFCAKLEKEDYVAALSCICNQNLEELLDFSKKAWLRLLETNTKRFQKDTLLRLTHKVSNIMARSTQLNPVLDNLLASCKELCRTSVLTNTISTETICTFQTEAALKRQ